MWFWKHCKLSEILNFTFLSHASYYGKICQHHLNVQGTDSATSNFNSFFCLKKKIKQNISFQLNYFEVAPNLNNRTRRRIFEECVWLWYAWKCIAPSNFTFQGSFPLFKWYDLLFCFWAKQSAGGVKQHVDQAIAAPFVAPLIESLGLCDPTRPVERRAWKRERIGTIIHVYATFTEHPTSWHRCEVNAIHHSHFPLLLPSTLMTTFSGLLSPFS